MSKFISILLVLVVSTLGLPTASGGPQPLSKSNTLQDAKQDFPTTEYKEQDLADPAKDAVRKEKQKRHNKFRMVAKNPQPWQTESIFIPEGNLNFPALPVSTSQLIALITRSASELPLLRNSLLKVH